MQNKFTISLLKPFSKSFTLVELIIVIIIVGILAAVGMTQYTKVVEKGRQAEARMILGQIRTFLNQYRLENGSINGITNADVNIGSASNQIPSSCRSTHYFYYNVEDKADPAVNLVARRCNTSGTGGSGGKPPDYFSYYLVILSVNFTTGDAFRYGGSW